MDTVDIHGILRRAVHAPSGDNSQPWTFSWQYGVLRVYNIPDRDNPYLNFEQSGSYVAHGMLIENIVLAASALKLKSTVRLFPDSAEPHCVASVVFAADGQSDILHTTIEARSTNRKWYSKRPLSPEVRREILNCTDSTGARIVLVEKKSERQILAAAGSEAEAVILEDEYLHSLLFENVVWSAKEEQEKQRGLYIETMEFNPIQRAIFALASKKRYAPLLRSIGLPRFVASQDANLYASGAAMGAIVVPDTRRESFVIAGRAFQRVWLASSLHKLSLQPITATLFFGRRLQAGQTEGLSAAHAQSMQEKYADIQRIFGVNQENIAVMFRIGYSKPPRARSSRADPVMRGGIL